MQERLANQKIPELLLSLSVPMICAQIVSLIYNMVDRIYIGRMEDGALAMAAVGLCVPLTTLIKASDGLFGRGGAPLSSISMGEGNQDEAEKIMTNSFLALVLSSFLIIAAVWGFTDQILNTFGANKETIGYARDYLRIYSLGTLFIQLTVGMNYFINAQGFTKFGMITVMIGAILNIILDPVFIFLFGMGVKGAAWATVIAQGVSCIWVMKFFFSGSSVLKIRREYLSFDGTIMKRIMKLGSSPFFMSSTEGLLTISFNQQLLLYGGTLAVSAMTILSSAFQIMLLPVEGVAQGSQPIISFNYGAGNYNRVRRTLSLAMWSTLAYSMAGALTMVICPQVLAGIFTKDPELTKITCRMLRVYIFGTAILGPNSTFQQAYNSLGEGKKSLFFAFYRKIILLIPLIYILPRILPINPVIAVVLAEPVSDILTTLTNACYFWCRFIPEKLPGQSIENTDKKALFS